MAKRIVAPLTDTQIKNTKPKDKDYLLPDGNGLYLNIKTIGTKVWTVRYTVDGKQSKTTIGNYPTVTLQQARDKNKDYQTKAKQGISPTVEKKEVKQAQILEAKNQLHLVLTEWISTLNLDTSTHKRKLRAFERDIFPYFCKYDKDHNIITSTPIKEITTHHTLDKALKSKEATGAIESTQRLLNDCKNFWRYAIRKCYTDINITDKLDKSDYKTPDEKHYPKITDERILAELLRAIDTNTSQKITNLALRLVCLLPLRADNLCKLKWSYVDFDKAVITIPRQEMKVKDRNLPDFKLPMPLQAIEILKEAQILTGWGEWVFHGISNHTTHLNKETINKALRTMGFNDEVSGRKQTTHSFRGTFRSLTETHADKHKALFEVREAVLDHQENDKSKRAYTHKADYSEQMRPLLQWWADYLDDIKTKV